MAVLSVLSIILIPWLIKLLAVNASIAKPGCQDSCGGVSIPYPFGIGEGCYYNSGFEVICNPSYSNKPLLATTGMELLGVTITGLVQVRNPIFFSNCSLTNNVSGVDLSLSTFKFSNVYNSFVAFGEDNYAMLFDDMSASFVGTGCLSLRYLRKSDCSHDFTCCQTAIPPVPITSYYIKMTSIYNNNKDSLCKSAFIVDKNWFSSQNPRGVNQTEYVPAVLEWGTYQGSCELLTGNTSSYMYCSSDGVCWTHLSKNHICVCGASSSTEVYNSNNNSYINGGCKFQDAGKCMDPEKSNCFMLCIYTENRFNCSCPDGYYADTYSNRCYKLYNELVDKKASDQAKIIIIGCVSGLGFLLFLVCTWWLYKIIGRRKAIKLKQKLFKRNGGLLLLQQLSAGKSNVEQTKLFTSKDLQKATDNFHMNRILGEGGQGTVYKGMLTDGRIVAIKKSKVVDEDKLDQFINEVVVLSQINHRNVVKLLGCCLEAEVPLLVYEFVPNGTLSQHLHEENEVFPITWEMRLQIAVDIAGALSYLHSAASAPIYHRDVKSTNILLDDKYRAKVSDFGISRSIAVDQTHLTTRVMGTFGYLDPEYFQSSHFTEKSDVYSFGVVTVELLTGQKPISLMRPAEERSLAIYFLLAMKEDRLFEILDARVLKEGGKQEIIAVAMLAKKCLNLNGKKRPTMKAVAIELERIRESREAAAGIAEEADLCDIGDMIEPWEVASSSTGSWWTNRSVAVPFDLDVQVQPLLSNTRFHV